MPGEFRIARLETLPPGPFAALKAESVAEGFGFLPRLEREWLSGTNRFNGPGEILFGVFSSEKLVGLGGLNREPGGAGRVRRLYVSAAVRRGGIGRALVDAITAHARDHFALLVLFTDNPEADAFYRRLGFQPAKPGLGYSHQLNLKDDLSAG
jgi:GNAT superfamily N-acetyltransferase